MSYYNDDWDNNNNCQIVNDEQFIIEQQQLREDEYFDKSFNIHVNLTDYIYDNCIPILQKCKFQDFYNLCIHGKKYIVKLENSEKKQENKSKKFLKNINKPIKPIKSISQKWIILGNKNSLKKNETETEKIDKKNIMNKYNWTKLTKEF